METERQTERRTEGRTLPIALPCQLTRSVKLDFTQYMQGH